MQRQRQLERCGWEFFRVRESVFYSNKMLALKGLWPALEERGIYPRQTVHHDCPGTDRQEEDPDASDFDEADVSEDERDDEPPLSSDSEGAAALSRRRPEEIASSEIQDAIVRVLSQCPNQSCTEKSLPARVLRDLRILTRGNPRLEFSKRVMRSVNALEKLSVVERYQAKNKRIRLIKSQLLF